ncbi:MAG: hypothetical protein HWN67_19070 [Candidatus Helarchaeota archaeon]|nr:hypothetical protein [Candidatus Helarchaeota archaeon]
MEVFDIQDTGEYELVTKGNTLKDVLKEENVYIILSHDWKICWIWIGKTCSNVRKKFAGARISRSILSDRQLAYSVKTVDSGDEPRNFKEILSDPIRKTYRPDAPTLEHIKIQQKVLKNQDIPADCKREAVLINDRFYVSVEVKVMDTKTHKFEPSEFLPEGVTFLPENYVSRLFVKHGKVEAVEFLTKDQHLKTVEKKTVKEKVVEDRREEKLEKVEETTKVIEKKAKPLIEDYKKKYNVTKIIPKKSKIKKRRVKSKKGDYKRKKKKSKRKRKSISGKTKK